MVCANCGAEVPAGADRCPGCGQAQEATAERESCEIVYTQTVEVLITCRFWARAVGLRGEYSAGESAPWLGHWPESDDPATLGAHQALVRRLVGQGWRHVGRGFFWYNDRFERGPGQ